MRFFRSTALAVLFASAAAPAFATCGTAPTATNDTAETYSDPILIDVLANDFDPDGEPLAVTVTAQTCAGSTSVDRGLVTFTPASALGSTCTIDYRITDPSGLTAAAKITISPPPPPPPPPLFSDGFESGDTGRWSVTEPLKKF